MSMRTTWRDGGVDKAVTAPVSLIVSAFAPVADARGASTPLLRRDLGDTVLVWIDLGDGRQRLGGSALAQVLRPARRRGAGPRRPAALAAFFALIQRLRDDGVLLAYHDIARRRPVRHARRDGVRVALRARRRAAGRRRHARRAVRRGARRGRPGGALRRRPTSWRRRAAPDCSRTSSAPARPAARACAFAAATCSCSTNRAIDLHRAWSATTHAMQRLRDNPDARGRGIRAAARRRRSGARAARLTFDPRRRPGRAVHRARRAAAHRDPARAGRQRPGRDGRGVRPRGLRRVRRAHERPRRRPPRARRLPRLRRLRRLLVRRRARRGRGLGEVDPVQLARARRVRRVLRAPRHVRARRVQRLPDDEQPARDRFPAPRTGRISCATRREQFEARLVDGRGARRRRRCSSRGMAGSRIPGRHRARRRATPSSAMPRSSRPRNRTSRCASSITAATRPKRYPYNPNGSPEGITGLTTADGRFTILMPHPERVWRTVQMSWHPARVGRGLAVVSGCSRNARAWLG